MLENCRLLSPGFALSCLGGGRRCDAWRVTIALLLRRRYLTLNGIGPTIQMLQRLTSTPCCTTWGTGLRKAGRRARILIRPRIWLQILTSQRYVRIRFGIIFSLGVKRNEGFRLIRQ